MIKRMACKLGLLAVIVTLSSFSFLYVNHSASGKSATFSCVINDKPFTVDNVMAILRKITGGETQLSISNDRFVKFSFLNPRPMEKIDLSNPGRKAFIRYEDPASLTVGEPIRGYAYITSINQKEKTVSGEFEFETKLVTNGQVKVVKIKQGRFENLPIEIR